MHLSLPGFSLRVRLCLASCLVCTWESLHVVRDLALVPQELNICTINQDSAFLLQLDVLIPLQRRETPILADDDLLATWEFVHRSSKSFDSRSTVRITSSDGEQDLTNIDTSDRSIWLSPRTTHPSLQSIGPSAGQHLVDSDNVIWVSANSEMEAFFTSNFDQIPAEQVESALLQNQYAIRLWHPPGMNSTDLLAQIRAASRASELSCSYSFETMCMQRGNSSTLARLRPRSKIRIFGSGTPRLNLDLGYGLRRCE